MSNLLIDDRPIMFLPGLAKMLESCERAIVLQQIHWLCQQPKSGRMHEGDKWVWGTYEEWADDYFPMWTANNLKKHILKLEKDGWLFSERLDSAQYNQTKFYRVNQEKIDAQKSAHSIGYSSIRSDGYSSIRSDEHSSIRSIYRTETSAETSAKTSTKSSSDDDFSKPDTSDERDGRVVLELLRAHPQIMYKDQNASYLAMQLEQDYEIDDIRLAMCKMATAHDAMADKGKNGIVAPLAYIKKILVTELGQVTKRDMVTVKITTVGSRGDRYDEFVRMDAAKAKAAGYEIVGATA